MGIFTHNVWLPVALSLAAFGSFAWALRGHFAVGGRMPEGMRYLSLASLISYLIYVSLLLFDTGEVTNGTILGLGGFALSLILFWWTVKTTRSRPIRLAYADADPEMIFIKGPYAYIRHPFYLSYIIFWISTALVGGGWQWAPALVLTTWYVRIARGEERRIRSSALGVVYEDYRRHTGMLLPRLVSRARPAWVRRMLTTQPMIALGTGAATALQRLSSMRRLFRSYAGTDKERPVRREQAALLFGVTLLFAFLGVGSCMLFTLAFERRMSVALGIAVGAVIALYVALVAGALRWNQRSDDVAFIRRSVLVLVALGLAWGALVNLFALDARPDQQGILIGLIMALVSTPMLAVPLSAALAFYIPISIACSVVILTQPIQNAAIYSFFGFLAFALTGVLYMNKTILERSIGRLNLQKEHETVRVFLREYEEVSSDWLWETDSSGRLRNVGTRMASALQFGKAYLENMSVFDFLSRSASEEDDAANLVMFLQERNAFRDATLAIVIGDRIRWLSLTGHPVFDETGTFCGFRGIGSDITEARLGRQKIEYLASHDGLTGLLNRQAFVDHLRSACHALDAEGFGLLLIDLDNFKGINDDLGHMAGDDALKIVADRLRASIRPGDVGGRIGGDEFAVLLARVDETDALDVAARINRALSVNLLIENLAITPSGSIGVSLFPIHGTDTEVLMRRADLALYRAKERGKNAVHLFDFELEHEHLGRIRLQAELASALEKGQIFLHYQPIVDVRTGDIVSVEALVRWRHPTRGILAAGIFMPSAEASDLMERLGEYVLRLACHAAAGWRNPVPVAVNLSPKQLRSGRFVSILRSSLTESGLPPGRLSLEMTETVFLASSERTVGQLDAVRGLGVRIILDDFGTGYSSLTYLRGFDVDGIKIDASFTRDLPGSQKVAAIVRTIGRLASDMSIYVVAEGVETVEQLNWLRANGIPFAQGYLLGRPGDDTVFSGSQSTRQDGLLSF